MMRRGILNTVAGAALVAGVLMLGGCWPFYSEEKARVRLHVEVMTPQGLRQGSGVLELINEKLPTLGIPNVHQGAVGMRGQAVIVDLPDGVLFVLLRLPDDADTTGLTNAIEKALVPRDPQDLSAETGIKQVQTISNAAPGALRADLPRETPGYYGPVKNWPMLVRFRDIDDPKSVEQVDPEQPEVMLGAGVTIKRVWIENTDAPVTTGIDKRLPQWFKPTFPRLEWKNLAISVV